ncbi:hypothetical protein BDZ89DRAFT_1136725 [Hymenopellis radicata]|nr:hypothetical protein BDZ89DRAFT_1136725 [Hymenopellis radicata]
MNVVWANLSELPPRLFEFRPRVGLDAVRARSAPAIFTDSDWAGVEGNWRRYVCFMDYRDLFAFNFSNTFRGPKHIAYFEENPRFREATRLIQVSLKVVSHSDLKYHDDTEFRTYFPEYPPIYFKGSSRGVNGNESSVEGVVTMAKDGSIRYHFREKVSMYDGETQWSSEGIQVGNVGCSAGVVGVWTTSMHDRGDPVGPFWLWKVDEDYPTQVFDHL